MLVKTGETIQIISFPTASTLGPAHSLPTQDLRKACINVMWVRGKSSRARSKHTRGLVMRTRARTRSWSWLLALPDELLEHLARQSVAVDFMAGLGFCTITCKGLRARLCAVAKDAAERRLQWWLPEDERSLDTISNHGRTLTYSAQLASTFDESKDRVWAAHAYPVLPAAPRSSFSLEIDRCHNNDGTILVGVCDEARLFGWGMDLGEMKLYRWTWSNAEFQWNDANHPPPDGYPSGEGFQLPPSRWLYGKVNGSRIYVTLEYSSDGVGTLKIGSNRFYGTPPSSEILTEVVLTGLPRHAKLCPYVCLGNVHDRVSFVERWI